MFRKETFLLIKKTYKRFIAIVLMVFIGVGFMMGLMNSATVMKESVSEYAKEYKLQDVQLYSPYGFCEEDVVALEESEVVENVYASKFVDVFAEVNDDPTVKVFRIREKDSSVNKYNLIEGNLPSSQNEILISNNTTKGLAIGDKVKVYLEDEEIDDKLTVSEFVVSGIVETPEYMSKISGTSTLNNMDLDLVCYADNEIFKSKYYTSIYITFNNTSNVRHFTNEYEKIIKEDIDEINGIISTQQEYLKKDILEEATKKIEDGEKKLEANKISGQKKLDDAKKKLDNANIQIVAGEMDLETYKSLINVANEKIGGGETTLNQRAADNNKKKQDVESKFGKSYSEALEEVSGDYTRYEANRVTIASSSTENINELKEQRNELQTKYDDPTTTPEEKERLLTQIQYLNAQITALEALNEQSEALKIVNQNLDNKYIALGYEGCENAYASLTAISSEEAAISFSKTTLQETYSYIEKIKTSLASKEKELEEGKKEYEEGLKEYNKGVKTFNDEIEKAEIEIRKAYQDIEELPDAKWTVLNRDKHYSSYMFKNNADQMQAIGIAIPIMFCLVAALVCMTTMTRLIDEQRSSIGTFIALGYSKKQVLCKYLVYAFLASIIGSIPGVLFGNVLFPSVIYNAWRLMYKFPDMILLFPLWIVLLCVFVFSIIMMTVTYFVVKNTLKEKPAELLRPKAPKSAKKTFVEKIDFVWKRLSFTSKVTARNLIRYKARFLMTVIGVAGCTGLLVIGFGVKDSISDVVDKQYGEILKYNYSINLKSDAQIDDLLKDLKADITNEEVVPFMKYYTKAYIGEDEETVILNAIDQRESSSILDLKSTSGNKELKIPTSGCIVTEKFAKNNNLKKGDYITIESKGGIKKEIEIKDICKWYFEHYIFISENYYETLFEESVNYNVIAVSSDDINSIKNVTVNYEDVESISDFTSFIEQFNTMIEALNIIIWVIIITAGALAFVVLFNLTNVNISERIREIATLKVLGFRDKEVDSYIFKEIVLLTIIGALVGLPLGKIEENFIMTVINMENIMFGTDIHFLSYVYAFAITFAFTFIVLIFTKKELRKIEMVESLKSVE